MHELPGAVNLRKQRLQEILLGYLQASAVPLGPGTDGLTLQDALLAYPQAAATGRVPDKAELLRRHPDLTDVLEAWFADSDAFYKFLGPIV